jgi:hypothetical protein
MNIARAEQFMVADGRWHFGVGDPNAMAWIIVGAYAVAAALTGRAFMTSLRAERALRIANPVESQNQRALKRLWLVVTVTLIVLGINKQLDLQSLATQWLRDRAYAHGWYDDRRRYQLDFIVAIIAFGSLATALLAIALRRVLRRVIGAVIGLGMLVSFVVIRASSFHYVDVLLNEGRIRANWVLELGGIALIAISAVRAEDRSRVAVPPRPVPPPTLESLPDQRLGHDLNSPAV